VTDLTTVTNRVNHTEIIYFISLLCALSTNPENVSRIITTFSSYKRARFLLTMKSAERVDVIGVSRAQQQTRLRRCQICNSMISLRFSSSDKQHDAQFHKCFFESIPRSASSITVNGFQEGL
jgi:uncharacterized protein YjiS (DUF1127 family)